MNDLAAIVRANTIFHDAESIGRILALAVRDLADEQACVNAMQTAGVRPWQLAADFRLIDAQIHANNLRAQRVWQRRFVERLAQKLDACVILPPVVPKLSLIALSGLVLLPCLASPAWAAGSVPTDEPFLTLLWSAIILAGAVLALRIVQAIAERTGGRDAD